MIDFSRTALVLIDLQKGIVKMEGQPHSATNVINNANRVIQLFNENNGFVAFVRVKFHDGKDVLTPNAMVSLPGDDDPDFSEFAEGLQITPQDYIVSKRHFSAFFGTDLDLQLRRRGIDTIIIGGISTHVGVDTTARDAYQNGYDQYFLTDMMTAPNRKLHDFPINEVFPIMGQVMTTDQFMKRVKNN
jgi:nicotinamidase-related amidase